MNIRKDCLLLFVQRRRSRRPKIILIELRMCDKNNNKNQMVMSCEREDTSGIEINNWKMTTAVLP